MAYSINFSGSTFAGDFTNELIASSILDARTIKEGYVTLHPNVDQNAAMVTVDTDVKIQNGGASFVPDGSTTYSEIKFDLGKFMINAEMDYSGLDNFWLASQQPRGRAGDFVAPATLEDALVLHHARKCNTFVNSAFWNRSASAIADIAGVSSATAGLTESVTGLIDTMVADAGVVKLGVAQNYKKSASFSDDADTVVTVDSTADYAVGDRVTINGLTDAGVTSLNGSTHTITEIASGTTFKIGLDFTASTGGDSGTVTIINRKTVVNALEAVYAQIDNRIRVAPDLAIYMSSRSAAAYKFAQAEAAYSPGVYSADYVLSFLGIPIYEIPECRDNFIGVSTVSNLHFATPLVSDLNNVLITNMAETTADRLVRFRLDFAFDVALSNPSTITILN